MTPAHPVSEADVAAALCPSCGGTGLKALLEARAENERLRSALEEYRMWRPCEKGHAAAHRELMKALDVASR
jgi:hypothetical protein